MSSDIQPQPSSSSEIDAVIVKALSEKTSFPVSGITSNLRSFLSQHISSEGRGMIKNMKMALVSRTVGVNQVEVLQRMNELLSESS